jgi:hypothetical protein
VVRRKTTPRCCCSKWCSKTKAASYRNTNLGPWWLFKMAVKSRWHLSMNVGDSLRSQLRTRCNNFKMQDYFLQHKNQAMATPESTGIHKHQASWHPNKEEGS